MIIKIKKSPFIGDFFIDKFTIKIVEYSRISGNKITTLTKWSKETIIQVVENPIRKNFSSHSCTDKIEKNKKSEG